MAWKMRASRLIVLKRAWRSILSEEPTNRKPFGRKA